MSSLEVGNKSITASYLSVWSCPAMTPVPSAPLQRPLNFNNLEPFTSTSKHNLLINRYCLLTYLRIRSETLSKSEFEVANMVTQTSKFKQAVTDSKKLKAKPTDDELLEVLLRDSHLSLSAYLRLIRVVVIRTLQSRYPGDQVRGRSQAWCFRLQGRSHAGTTSASFLALQLRG